MTDENKGFEDWMAELRRLADERGVSWLFSGDCAEQRASFEKGLSPEDELASFDVMCEWRGCGCGGGG